MRTNNMKTILITLTGLMALTACDSANQMIDKAQETANQKVETLQTKLETIDINGINLDLLKQSPELAAQLTESINQALQVDLTNLTEVEAVKAKVANAYACLVEVSSKTTAEEVINTLMQNISNAEVATLIETVVNQTSTTMACVK